MNKLLSCFRTTALAAILVSPSALAGTIDLRDLPNNFDQSSWNGGGTRLYAQSLVADSSYLTSFAFRPDSNNREMQYQIYVTGARPVGDGLGYAPDFDDIRYSSDILNLQAVEGWVEVTCNINVSVSPEETVFLVFDGLTDSGGASGTIRATEYYGSEQYPPGEFVYANENYGPAPSNSYAWSHRSSANEDLAVLAVFAAEPVLGENVCGEGFKPVADVPVPALSSWAIAVLTLLLLGLGLRRKPLNRQLPR